MLITTALAQLRRATLHQATSRPRYAADRLLILADAAEEAGTALQLHGEAAGAAAAHRCAAELRQLAPVLAAP